MATNSSPGVTRRESWVRPCTMPFGLPSTRRAVGTWSRSAATHLGVGTNGIYLQFTRDAPDAPAARAAVEATPRQARRVQVLRRQGGAAVRRQGAVAAQPRALVLSKDRRPRAA